MKPVVHHEVRSLRDRIDLIAQRVNNSIVYPQKRTDDTEFMTYDLARALVRGCAQHGKASEIEPIHAIFDYVKANIEYRQDPVDYDLFMGVGRIINSGAGDCFTHDTKIIVRSKGTGYYEVKTLGELKSSWPLYEALSYDFDAKKWTFSPITAFTEKGEREVWESRLRTGPTFRHTPDHKVWTLTGQNAAKGKVSERSLGEIQSETISRKRRVLIARKIPDLGLGEWSKSESYLAGIYAAEGCSSIVSRGRKVSIAQDKADIRAKIEKALSGAGIPFSSSKRQVHHCYNILKSDGKDWLAGIGNNSFDMAFTPALLSGTRRHILEMMEAHGDGDAYHPKKESRHFKKVKAIHSTSSERLADNLQLMSMIIGESWYTQLQKKHGGAGRKPIYRFHRWLDSTRAAKRFVPGMEGLSYSPLRESIPMGKMPVCDITVADTHNFVLSNGMIAHNCDEHTTILCSLLSSIGYRTGAKVISADGNGWHIYSIVGVDPAFNGRPTAIIPLDSAYGSEPGWEPDPKYRRHEYQCTFQQGKTIGWRKNR